MQLYALYRCSNKLLVFMIVVFLAEIGPVMWILISNNLLSCGKPLPCIETPVIRDSNPFRRDNVPVSHFIRRT
ncbi:hypothetical protein J3A83DRAFT_4227056 [Scleroderma citrinum]